MPQPTQPLDVESTGKIAGLAVSSLVLLTYGRRVGLWLVRAIVGRAFQPELTRSAHSAAAIIGLSERLDTLEETMASNAELLAQIPQMASDLAALREDQREMRGDIKLVLQQLGQVQGARGVAQNSGGQV